MYCLVNIPEFILKEQYKGSQRPLDDMGTNTGNCLFWESTKNILSQQGLKLLSVQRYNKDTSYYQSKITKVVFTSANLINNWDIKYENKDWLANTAKHINNYLCILNALSCKKYLISIGAQSDNLNLFKFQEDQKRIYIDFFSHFDTIYLRGEYTYKLLKYNDIPMQNMESVGCPSLLLRPISLNNLQKKLDGIRRKKIQKIHVGISTGGTIKSEELNNNFYNIMQDSTIYTLVQCNSRWTKFVTGRLFFPPLKIGKGSNLLKTYLLIWNITKNRNNFMYSDYYSELIDHFKENIDCMITTRIHGTILGTLAGVPSLCIVTDSRTYELCEQMGIPYINCIDKCISFKNKAELVRIFLENCVYSDKLNQTITNMKQKYTVFGNHN